MPRGVYLGEFEEIVLLALRRVHEPCGMEIRREIAERTGRDVSIGAVYATVERLRSKRLLRAKEIPPHIGPDNRAWRFFELTAAGDEALRDSERMRRRLRLDIRRRAHDGN